MKRCRNSQKDEEVLIVGWVFPRGDAVAKILCEECGETFYTSPENRCLVIEREMSVLCVACVRLLALRGKEGLTIAGKMRQGKIVDLPES